MKRAWNMLRGYAKLPLLLAGIFVVPPASGQTSPIVQPHISFVGTAGAACVGCKLYSYAAGTTTPLATYTDSTGGTPNPNPTILDASGSAVIWLKGPSLYKLALYDSLGNLIWTADNIPVMGTGGGSSGVTSINMATGAFTFTGPGVTCTTTTCTFSGTGSGVSSINGNGGAFTFTGTGFSCTGATCTFSTGGPSTQGPFTSRWFNAYDSGSGLFTSAQPAFSDLTGIISQTQLPSGVAIISFGSGTPSGGLCPYEGCTYFDSSVFPYQIYVWHSAAWVKVSGPAPYAAISITAHSGTLATSGAPDTNGFVTLDHTATTTINVSGLTNGSRFQIQLFQDSTGGATVTLGTGCTWMQQTGSGFVASTTPTLTAAASGYNLLQATTDGTRCSYKVQ